MGFCLVAQGELVELLAVQVRQVGRNNGAGRRFKQSLDRPEFLRLELLDFGFTFADQPQGDRLHAACGLRARQLAPQHGRQRKADQIIQCAAGHIGVNQRLVYFAGLGDGVQNGLLGDLIKGNAVDGLILEDFLVPQDFKDVPRDGLPFTVRVGSEIDGIGAFDGCDNFFNGPVGAVAQLPIHGKVVVRTHGAILRGQIADMPERSEDRIVLAQILINGLRLGGRFHDDNFLSHELPNFSSLTNEGHAVTGLPFYTSSQL